MAYQGHIIIPTDNDESGRVIRQIQAKMISTFGGYSRYEGVGGWEGSDGQVIEDHVRLVVNAIDMDREAFENYMETEALYAKNLMDEDAVLIEIREIDIRLV